jgi:hypothetical protein
MIEQMNKQLASEGKAPFQLKTIPQGAATSLWAAVVALADEVGGKYCDYHRGQRRTSRLRGGPNQRPSPLEEK